MVYTYLSAVYYHFNLDGKERAGFSAVPAVFLVTLQFILPVNPMEFSDSTCENDCEHRVVEICEVMPNWHTVQLAIQNICHVYMAQQFDNFAHAKLGEELLKVIERQKGEENGVLGMKLNSHKFSVVPSGS